MVDVAQRLKFLVPIISGTLGTDAVTKNSASRRRGQILFQLKEIVDKLKDFVLRTGPFARVSMDELGTEGRVDGTETRCCCDLDAEV